MARAIKKTGKTTSQAIAIAVSRMKVWASGTGVDKATQTKAAAALAEWEKLRGKSHAKTAAKDTAKMSGQGEILCLAKTVTSFNVDNVRAAWNTQRQNARTAYYQAYPNGGSEPAPSYSYIKEMWTDYLIVCAGDGDDLFKVGYSVNKDGDVTFAKPVAVKAQYVVVKAADIDAELSNADLVLLMAAVPSCQFSALDTVLAATGATTAVAKLFAMTDRK